MDHLPNIKEILGGKEQFLTSSISSRETFRPSLLETAAEAESATGASVLLFCWSLWDSWESWFVDCISGVF